MVWSTTDLANSSTADAADDNALPCPFDIVKSCSSPEALIPDRSGARHLISEINAALVRHSGRILILSWNYYADGSAIEKNTFDYDTMIRALQLQ